MVIWHVVEITFVHGTCKKWYENDNSPEILVYSLLQFISWQINKNIVLKQPEMSLSIQLGGVFHGSGQDRLSTPCVHRNVKHAKGRPPYSSLLMFSLPGSHHCHFLISQNAPGPPLTWPHGSVAVQSCSRVAVWVCLCGQSEKLLNRTDTAYNEISMQICRSHWCLTKTAEIFYNPR